MSTRRIYTWALLPLFLAAGLSLHSGPAPAQGQLRIQEAQEPLAARPQIPDPDGLMILIRTTLIALDQANRTGNYTVLRDIGSPGFREANDASRLAELFADIRNRGLVLAPVSVVDATLTSRPALDANNMLHLAGFFHTRPEELNFEMLFELVNGDWRLFGLGIGTSTAGEPAAQAVPPAAPAVQAAPSAPAAQATPREAEPTERQARRQDRAAAPASASPLIEEAQRLLGQLGYQPGSADGFLGPRTTNAVRAFQRDAGLPETGEITAEVVEAMRAHVE